MAEETKDKAEETTSKEDAEETRPSSKPDDATTTTTPAATPTASSPSTSSPSTAPPRAAPRAAGRPARRQGGGGHRGRFHRKPKVCLFCVEKNLSIDYKQPDVLRRFVNNNGKMRPRRQTGTCARHQRRLAMAIKRSRHLAMMAFVGDSVG